MVGDRWMTQELTESQCKAKRLRSLASVIRYRALFADEPVWREEVARAEEMESEADALERRP